MTFFLIQLFKGGEVLLAYEISLTFCTLFFSQLYSIFPLVDRIGCRCKINYLVFHIVLIYNPPSLHFDTFQNFFGSSDIFLNKHVTFWEIFILGSEVAMNSTIYTTILPFFQVTKIHQSP